jgi:hypothetical protein
VPVIVKGGENGILKFFLRNNPGVGVLEDIVAEVGDKIVVVKEFKKVDFKIAINFLGVFHCEKGFPVMEGVEGKMRHILMSLPKCPLIVIVKMCGKKNWENVKKFAKSVHDFHCSGKLTFAE